jgi:hypothetical protein
MSNPLAVLPRELGAQRWHPGLLPGKGGVRAANLVEAIMRHVLQNDGLHREHVGELHLRDVEVAWWLRALAALAENPGLVPGALMTAQNHVYIQFQGISLVPSSGH